MGVDMDMQGGGMPSYADMRHGQMQDMHMQAAAGHSGFQVRGGTSDKAIYCMQPPVLASLTLPK